MESEKYTSMMLDKELNYESDGELCFAAPPKPRSAKQVLCTGHTQSSDIAPVITVRLPMSLTPSAFVAYMREFLPGMVVVDNVSELSEGEFLRFQL